MKANKKFIEDTEGNTGAVAIMMAGVIALLIAIAIGVLVFYKINAGIATGSSTGATIHTQVNTTMQTVWTLLPITAIIAIAGVMIAIVTRFGSGGGA